MHTHIENTKSDYRMVIFNCSTLLLISCLCMSCIPMGLGHAKRSLRGTWQVNYIFSVDEDWSGPYTDHSRKETGRLGTFTFSKNEAAYSYKRLGKTYSGDSTWKLTAELVANGFIPAPRYTLHLNDQAYDVSFGDRTSDAHKDAHEIALQLIPATQEGPCRRCYYIMELTKN